MTSTFIHSLSGIPRWPYSLHRCFTFWWHTSTFRPPKLCPACQKVATSGRRHTEGNTVLRPLPCCIFCPLQRLNKLPKLLGNLGMRRSCPWPPVLHFASRTKGTWLSSFLGPVWVPTLSSVLLLISFPTISKKQPPQQVPSKAWVSSGPQQSPHRLGVIISFSPALGPLESSHPSLLSQPCSRDCIHTPHYGNHFPSFLLTLASTCSLHVLCCQLLCLER